MGLPQDKIEKLGDGIGEEVYKDLNRHLDNLTKREVSNQDSHRVIEDGYIKGVKKFKKQEEKKG